MTDLWQLTLVLLVGVVLLEGVAIFALARAIGLLQLKLGPEPAPLQTSSGLVVGQRVPLLTGYDLRGKQPATLDMHAGRWAVLFLTPTCSVCRSVARDAGRVSRDRSWGATFVMVARGAHDQNRVAFGDSGDGLIVFSDTNGDMHELYKIDEVPYAFLVVDGHIRAKGVVNDRDQLEMLLQGEMRKASDPVWVPTREPVVAGHKEA